MPSEIQETNIDTQTVGSLAMFPLCDSLELQHLKTELPHYIAACEDVYPSHDILTFWKNHASSLHHWSATASKVAVVQPSSAAGEMVFFSTKAIVQ